jgi:hypothetical protein
MNQKEMIEKCRKKGLDVTIPLLYRHGKKYGFLVKKSSEGRERYSVDENKFNEWLDKIEIEEGWVAIGPAARKNNMAYTALKYRLVSNNCEIKPMGIIDGGYLYARQEDVKRAVTSYNRRVEE